jgi:hypothetical protein
MALLNFPSNPAIGDTYTFGDQVYKWSGSAWLRSFLNNITVGSVTSTNAITIGSGNQTVVINSSTIYINNSSVLTTSTLYTSVSTGTGISISTATGQLVISDISTLQDITNNGYTTTNPITITNDTVSTSTSSGALQITGGVGIGGAVYIDNTSYVSGAQIITAATIDAYVTASLYVSTLQLVTSNGNTTTVAIKILNTTSSTSTDSGALVVKGGVGVGGDLRVGGDIYTTNLNIADAVFDSTLILVNTTATTVVDSYSISEFRSAKYLIQIDEGMGPAASFQVIEILLLVDNVGTVYATEYGVLTSNGEMGEFAADVGVDDRVRLYFTPYQESDKELVVLRTALAV